MPINPTLALGVKQPDIDNPLNAMGKALSLRRYAMEGPLMAERLENERLQNQKLAEQNADNQILKQSWRDAQGNLDKWVSLSTERGASPNAITTIQQHATGIKERMSQLKDKDIEQHGKISKMLGDKAAAILQLPEERQPAAYASAIQELGTSNLLTPEQFSQIPKEFPGREALEIQMHEAIGSSKLADDIRADRTAKRLEDEASLKRPGEEADAEAKVRKNVATKLAAAADSGDKEEYAQAYYSLSKDERAPFTHPDKYDPDATPAAVRNLGMTPSEQSAASHRDVLEDIAQQNLKLRKAHDEREKTQTANSLASERTKAHTEFDVASRNESTLHAMRRSLGNAIASGTLYVNRYGRTVPIDTVSSDAAAKAALIEEMKGRLESSTEELKNTIENKYNAGERLGMKPKVTRDQALAAVEANGKKPQGPQQEVPAPSATPNPTKYARTATGKNGQKVGTNDDGKTWFDIQTGNPLQ